MDSVKHYSQYTFYYLSHLNCRTQIFNEVLSLSPMLGQNKHENVEGIED